MKPRGVHNKRRSGFQSTANDRQYFDSEADAPHRRLQPVLSFALLRIQLLSLRRVFYYSARLTPLGVGMFGFSVRLAVRYSGGPRRRGRIDIRKRGLSLRRISIIEQDDEKGFRQIHEWDFLLTSAEWMTKADSDGSIRSNWVQLTYCRVAV